MTRAHVRQNALGSSAPRPEKTSMPVISTEAETVGLPSAITKWAISPTSTMM